tara:strand:+ start:3346 stop:3774 length:429 start_codon:yes stop_codon:yes gene_type:complete
MAHFEYYNSMRTVTETVRDSHISLIKSVCSELGAPERSDEMIKKYVDDSIRIKKFHDKNHPKKPKSGYMIYGVENRERVKKSLPENTAFSDVVRKIAEEWNKLSEADKKAYNVKADEDKVRYARELEDYKSEIYKFYVSPSV